jgi:hypothetical protein
LPAEEHPSFEAARKPSHWLATAEMLEQAAALMPVASAEGMQAHLAEVLTLSPRAGSFINNDALPSLLLFPVRMMLLGQSLENLVKGLIVAEHPKAVTIRGDKVSYPWEYTHLSLELFEQADVALSCLETEIVRTLAEFVAWAGRFPAPTKVPVAEQRWESEFDPYYRRLSRYLRRRLKTHMRAEQRMKIEREELEQLAKSDRDGVILFENAEDEETPAVEVECECGSWFRLSPRYPAVICLCRKLYRGRLRAIQQGGFRMDVQIYPQWIPPDAPRDIPDRERLHD